MIVESSHYEGAAISTCNFNGIWGEDNRLRPCDRVKRTERTCPHDEIISGRNPIT